MVKVKLYNFEKEKVDEILEEESHLDGSNGKFSELSLISLFNNAVTPNYISFDGKGIDLLDNNTQFYKSGDYVGFISLAVSGADRTFGSIGNTPSFFLIQKDNTPIRFPIDKGMTIEFYGDCCSKIRVDYLDENHNSVIANEILVDGDSVKIPDPGFVVYGIDVYFIETKYVGQFIKFYSVKFGDVIDFDRFKNIEVLEQTTVISDDLPANSIEFDAIYDGDDNLSIYDEAMVSVNSNGTYYGTFYVDDWEKTSKNSYRVRGLSAVSLLDKSKFMGFDEAISGYLDEFSKKLTEKTGVKIKYDGNSVLAGGLSIDSFRRSLCKIAFASSLIVDESRGGDVRLIRFPKEIKSTITNESKRIIGESKFTRKQPITSMVVKEVSNPSAVSVVIQKTIKLGNAANSRTTYFFEKPVTLKLDQYPTDVITIHSYSSRYIDFTATQENYGLVVSEVNYGYNVRTIYNESASEKVRNEVDYSRLDATINWLYSEWGNDFTKDEQLLVYANSKGTVNARIVLEDEKVGDLITIETAHDGLVTGIITSMNIHFGYRDVADIEVLQWNGLN